MTGRRRRRGRDGRDGLFWNQPTAPDAPPEVHDNPLLRPCPRDDGGCGAGIYQACTKPVRGGRERLTGYHPARRKTPHMAFNTTEAQQFDRLLDYLLGAGQPVTSERARLACEFFAVRANRADGRCRTDRDVRTAWPGSLAERLHDDRRWLDEIRAALGIDAATNPVHAIEQWRGEFHRLQDQLEQLLTKLNDRRASDNEPKKIPEDVTAQPERCELTELLVDECAHCQGHTSVDEQATAELPGPGWRYAQFDGRCAGCGEQFPAGTPIRKDPDLDGWVADDGCTRTEI